MFKLVFRIIFLPSQEALHKLQIVSGVMRDYPVRCWAYFLLISSRMYPSTGPLRRCSINVFFIKKWMPSCVAWGQTSSMSTVWDKKANFCLYPHISHYLKTKFVTLVLNFSLLFFCRISSVRWRTTTTARKPSSSACPAWPTSTPRSRRKRTPRRRRDKFLASTLFFNFAEIRQGFEPRSVLNAIPEWNSKRAIFKLGQNYCSDLSSIFFAVLNSNMATSLHSYKE